MHDVHLSNLIMGTGFVFITAGLLLLFHHTFSIRRGKRGRIHAVFNLERWSFRSIFPAVVMITLGALFMAGGSLVGDH
jgi:hypothetical protein